MYYFFYGVYINYEDFMYNLCIEDKVIVLCIKIYFMINFIVYRVFFVWNIFIFDLIKIFNVINYIRMVFRFDNLCNLNFWGEFL